ncbi:hypothetical protein Pint_10475 [Pistacia integerrima]|uniref:Uncharacterized protein n=1 Tax=Pistacia integerrima TaxID=434235 RepID=A0ACC0XJJ3_9ROSI|nr:hypothetical protein Pint_10475 [Pistacia integerrima]
MSILTSSSSPSSPFVFICFLIIFLLTLTTPISLSKTARRQLSVDYYAKSCPQLEQLVGSVTSQQFKEAPVSGPATIRLFFHDCFVDGCDGSILISTVPGSKVLAEKDAMDNKDLRKEAFESITKAKALVESKCPGIVSCADILAIAARDFVHLAGGPFYQVKKGRWDGQLSMASWVPSNLPHSNYTIDQLIKLFNAKGLTVEDLVVLSGAHTIGFAHCNQFVSRLYDYHGTKKPDPAIDPRLLKALRMSCPHSGGNTDIVAPFDVTTPFVFDHAYYANLEGKLGLLASDQALFLDPRTKSLVQEFGKDKHNTPKRTQLHHQKLQIKAMRAVVQRVTSASIEVDGRIVSEIGPGLLVLVGLHESDTDSDADFICRKVLNMRLFPNENTGKGWDFNVMQKNYGVLLVSQFTLYGILKGNKPDFHVAMPPQNARPFYDSLVEKFRKSYNPDAIKGHISIRVDELIELDVRSLQNTYGVFGAMMKVNLVNDGPVTMQLDSSPSSKLVP